MRHRITTFDLSVPVLARCLFSFLFSLLLFGLLLLGLNGSSCPVFAQVGNGSDQVGSSSGPNREVSEARSGEVSRDERSGETAEEARVPSRRSDYKQTIDIAQATDNVNLRPPQETRSELQELQPIDLTPVKLPERASAFNPMESYKTKALYRLPGRLFFSASVENSLRLETNVYQTLHQNRADMIYRVLPNVTIGWALNKKTRVATNYFMFRDQYTRQDPRLSRNIHSVGFRIDRDIPVNERTNITAGFFARELLFNLHNAANHPLSDLIPSAVVTRRYGQNGVIYGSALGQFRFRDVLGRYQEIDQFYSVGTVYRKRPWIFLADNTFVVNTGKTKLRGGHNNEIFIITLEAARSISNRWPVVAFVRAEPIFNIGANSSPGFAGFNFRIFGGLRMEVAKPAIFPIKLKQS